MSVVVPNRCVVLSDCGSVSHMNSEEIRADERNKIADWMVRRADDYMVVSRQYGAMSFSDRIVADELYDVARRLRQGSVGEQNCQHCGAPSGISSECKPCLRRIMGMSPR